MVQQNHGNAPRRLGAIDIGSNSVRLQIADALQRSNGLPSLTTVKNERQVTRLGEGVFGKRGKISRSALKETCVVLRRMKRSCEIHDVQEFRAVATSAVREAKNRLEFTDIAEEILRCPVEIISGDEEAHLVHLGIHARWPQLRKRERPLIIDLGGGSAQIIHGASPKVVEKLSRPIGSVRLKQKFLKHDPPKKREIRALTDYIDEKLAIVIERVSPTSISRLLATSGAAAAVVCAINEVRVDRDEADRLSAPYAQVETLFERVSTMDLAHRRRIRGVGRRRAEVLLPGIAVLMAIMRSFGKDELTYTSAGVRDGIITDLSMRGNQRQGRQQHFHVFLCHNRADKPVIRDIAERLRDRGIVPWLDEEQIRPGEQWMTALENQIDKISSAALFLGPEGMTPYMKMEANALLRQFAERNSPVIPVILPGLQDEPDFPQFLRDLMWVDFRQNMPDPFERLIWGILGDPRTKLTSSGDRQLRPVAMR